jgi:hypothetical protein
MLIETTLGRLGDVCLLMARLWEEVVQMDPELYGAVDQMARDAPLLVAELEGRLFEADSNSWVARICGVYNDERTWWIQVANADDDTASVVLRCSRFATVEHAAAVLRRWRPTPAFSLRVMNVMLAP